MTPYPLLGTIHIPHLSDSFNRYPIGGPPPPPSYSIPSPPYPLDLLDSLYQFFYCIYDCCAPPLSEGPPTSSASCTSLPLPLPLPLHVLPTLSRPAHPPYPPWLVLLLIPLPYFCQSLVVVSTGPSGLTPNSLSTVGRMWWALAAGQTPGSPPVPF